MIIIQAKNFICDIKVQTFHVNVATLKWQLIKIKLKYLKKTKKQFKFLI